MKELVNQIMSDQLDALAIIEGDHSYFLMTSYLRSRGQIQGSLSVYSSGRLSSQILNHMRLNGINLIDFWELLRLRGIGKIMWFPSIRLLTPIYDLLCEIPCEELILGADGPKNIGFLRRWPNARSVTLVQFFSGDPRLSYWTGDLASSAPVLHHGVPGHIYGQALLELFDMCRADHKTILGKLSGDDAVVALRSGWSGDLFQSMKDLNAHLSSRSERSRVFLRSSQLSGGTETFTNLQELTECFGPSVELLDWDDFISPLELDGYFRNPEILIASGIIGSPGTLVPFSGSLGLSLTAAFPQKSIDVLYPSANNENLGQNEQQEWLRSFGNSLKGKTRETAERPNVELEYDNQLSHHLELLDKRYRFLKPRHRGLIRELLTSIVKKH